MTNLLEIIDLKICFQQLGRAVNAVDGISLNIAQKEILGLVGESGSGKTVTSLAITKLLPKNAFFSGKVNFEGKDLLMLSGEELRLIRGKTIAYIFQEPTSYLNPVFTIGYQIMEVIMLHQNKDKAQAREEAISLLETVHIPSAQEQILRYPHQLSGGMNQRVMIAMALACKPKLLIADEPTTSLDVTIEAQVLDLLLELKNRFGLSILLITHDLSIVERIADTIAIIREGRLVESGQKKDIFSSPKDSYTKNLLESIPRL